ncbi:TetR/AcrR family transcriptional regulator [Paraburkholderia sp. Ac-20340]|uniref:TetR/AcrR family transcriptional regulator n=1 Tax=Paraburkholderia sp. Ac-20340 TaxID=2703888 RepID=UPI001981464C|nr:TetR/AcrR family transcriptional regulator [Paraburkholderia sp. Ac-20340]MBN3857438.1 TetR/AcrR family transcriptional regulator [Paraburkholderia sp. Ac-20340]
MGETRGAVVTATRAKSNKPAATPEPALDKEDHRIRTGAVRREATRRKMLSAAVGVFAQKGPDAASIDDFIAAAGVARGTFYNYFKTTAELLDAVTSELSDEVIAGIEVCVATIDNPVERIWIGCQTYVQVALMHPAWGAFITRTGIRGDASGRLTDIYLPRDLEAARARGIAHFENTRAAKDLVMGAIYQSIETVLTGGAPSEHPRAVMKLALGALGVTPALLATLEKQPLPELELPDGLKSLEAAAETPQR